MAEGSQYKRGRQQVIRRGMHQQGSEDGGREAEGDSVLKRRPPLIQTVSASAKGGGAWTRSPVRSTLLTAWTQPPGFDPAGVQTTPSCPGAGLLLITAQGRKPHGPPPRLTLALLPPQVKSVHRTYLPLPGASTVMSPTHSCRFRCLLNQRSSTCTSGSGSLLLLVTYLPPGPSPPPSAPADVPLPARVLRL